MKRNALFLVFPLLLAGCFKKCCNETSKEASDTAVVSAPATEQNTVPTAEQSSTPTPQHNSETDTTAKA